MNKKMLLDSVYDSLELVKDDVNYLNNEVNKHLQSLGCSEQIKYKAPIDNDIERAKQIISQLDVEDIILMERLVVHIQTAAELQMLNQQELDQRIKDMAVTINDLPVVDIDTLVS